MRVGFIGLGNMGGDQVRCLVENQVDLTVYDVSDVAMQAFAKSAHLAHSIPELAERSELVSICVRDDRQLRDVLEGPQGLLAHLSTGSIVLVHSTVFPETMIDLAQEAKQRNIYMLDAAVSRTKHGDGPFLAVLIGGDAAVLDRVRSIINAYATNIFHAGAVGAGMALKIINNLITWSSIVSTAQAFSLGNASGVKLDALHGLMSANGNFTRVSELFSSIFMGAKVEREFLESQLGIGSKDLLLAENLAAAVGTKTPLAKQSREYLPTAMLGQ